MTGIVLLLFVFTFLIVWLILFMLARRVPMFMMSWFDMRKNSYKYKRKIF